jgi:hypothetical protein
MEKAGQGSGKVKKILSGRIVDDGKQGDITGFR